MLNANIKKIIIISFAVSFVIILIGALIIHNTKVQILYDKCCDGIKCNSGYDYNKQQCFNISCYEELTKLPKEPLYYNIEDNKTFYNSNFNNIKLEIKNCYYQPKEINLSGIGRFQ
jgi:hypothetical protein